MESASKRSQTLVLSIAHVRMLNDGCSLTVVASKFGVGKSTVSDLKKNASKIIEFRRKTEEMGIVRPTKVMKLGSNEKVDEAVFLWFKHARLSGAPVSGQLLCEKAMRLSQIIADSDTSRFSASSGWLKRFCKRFGIRGLTLNGEKLSSDSAAAADFASSFQKFIEDEGLSLHQVFNCDESALYFRLLPQKTLAGAFEKSASGWKKSKERVTILACSNASGSMKLPILVIGKAEKPRCRKQYTMSSVFNSMNCCQVLSWNQYRFASDFILREEECLDDTRNIWQLVQSLFCAQCERSTRTDGHRTESCLNS